jgi:hypothetical protein
MMVPAIPPVALIFIHYQAKPTLKLYLRVTSYPRQRA